MKELSIEEKAKAYDEALEKLRDFYRDYDTVSCLIDVKEELANLFPELKESEDEKIRKFLIKWIQDNYYHGTTEIPTKTLIAWLERQGGEKPRYSIGDVLCDKSCTTLNKESQPNFEITDIRNGMYICDKCSFPISQQDEYELVAKRIEQKPTFEMITPEESLGIDSETYNKIVDECIYGDDKQKLAWGEEDECYMSECIGAIATKDGWSFEEKRKTKHWLKSLKDRVQPKQEWSEEDEKMIGRIRGIIEAYAFSQSAVDVNGDLCEKEYIEADNWLKSLKDRYTWKPSDEQIKVLESLIENRSIQRRHLVSLYEQLKNLKRE